MSKGNDLTTRPVQTKETTTNSDRVSVCMYVTSSNDVNYWCAVECCLRDQSFTVAKLIVHYITLQQLPGVYANIQDK